MAIHISELRVGRRNKYGAKVKIVDGHRFASQKEALRYGALKLLERAGEIRRLVLQPKFPFHLKDRTIFTYIADFEYEERVRGTVGALQIAGAFPHWNRVIEDSKGFRTKEYRLKKKLIECYYGITIRET